MNKQITTTTKQRFTDLLIPAMVLAVLLVYSYARFFLIPYIGFQYSGASGEIVEVFVPQTSSPFLLSGDILTSVNGLSWDELHDEFKANPLAEVQIGENVALEVEGTNGPQEIIWHIPGFNPPEFWTRMINTWPIGYVFWLAGTAALLLVRPRNKRWALLVAFNYITAIWVTAGGLSSWGVWGSSFIFRAAVWLSLPIYLHFHWNFPSQLRPIPKAVWVLMYLGSGVMILSHWVGLIGRGAYFFAFIAAIGLSFLILVYRYVRRLEDRRDIALLFFATVVAFAPAAFLALRSGDASINPALPGFLFSLIALPGTYFFVVYRHQLGGLEVRANRVISVYLFAILLILLTLALLPLYSRVGGQESLGGAIVVTALITTLVTSFGFPSFQRFVENRLLRIPKPEERLLSGFAGQISTAISKKKLADILLEDVLPSLLIRQSMLLALENGSHEEIYSQGIMKAQLPNLNNVKQWATASNILEQTDSHINEPWVRLAIPLQIGNSTIGLWLLGRKDPDDFFHQNERILLRSLADQMAIALTNIAQARSLRALHQADIERQEAERIHLARELHDDVLPRINELNTPTIAAADLKAKLDTLVDRIRRLMSGLRPPLLDQGLYLALEQLVEDLKEKAPPKIKLEFQVKPTFVRFDPAIEQHLFRIIQQACENAIKHGSPKAISISGEIHKDRVDLTVKDDGSGFNLEGTTLVDLLRERHFGLAGMSERAAMIGAELSINSAPGQGTRIRLLWRAKKEENSEYSSIVKGRNTSL